MRRLAAALLAYESDRQRETGGRDRGRLDEVALLGDAFDAVDDGQQREQALNGAEAGRARVAEFRQDARPR
jgi:hypothetical protein